MATAGGLRDLYGYEAFYAWGYGGQFIYVVPDLRLVTVMTSSTRPRGGPPRAPAVALRVDGGRDRANGRPRPLDCLRTGVLAAEPFSSSTQVDAKG